MAQQVKVHVKPNKLNLFLRVHIAERRANCSKMSSDLHMHTMACVGTHAHTCVCTHACVRTHTHIHT